MGALLMLSPRPMLIPTSSTMVSATTDMAMEAMPTPASTATTDTTASAPLTPSPRLTPIPMSSTTVSATTAMATVTPLPTAATTTTASAPLRLSPRLMPSPTTPTATPAPTAMPAGDTAVSTATTDKQRRRTSFAQPDEGTQQYSVFKCDEQTTTSQRKYR